VKDTKRDPLTGSLQCSTMVHQPILGGLCADGPAAAKVTRFLTAGAFLACGNCTLQGTNDIPVEPPPAAGGSTTVKGVMHYLGYSKPTTCGLRLTNAPTKEALCGDAEVAVTSEMQVGSLLVG
jgi:hypothetical protein